MIDKNTWLAETEILQKNYFSNDPGSYQGSERAEYIRTNVLAAVAELVEFLDEVHWKPWSSDAPGEITDKSAFISEAVDVGHFIANALLAGGVTDQEYWDAYNAKMERNRVRMSKAGGYQARRNKCPRCKRELDKPGAYVIDEQRYVQDGDKHKMRFILVCQGDGCGERFDYELVVGQESLPGAVT